MSKVDRLSIVAFRAVDDKERTLQYINEHAKILEEIGVASAIKMNYDWCLDPESTIIAAIHHDLGMVGGVRIQMGRKEYPMAMEQAIGVIDSEFTGTISALVESGTAELCGLWVAHRYSGRGLPSLLVPAGVAVASQLTISSLLTFAAEYTLQLTLDAGFSKMKEVGLNGELIYPIPTIRSYAMEISDLFTLEHSPLKFRHHILSLRIRPYQNIVLKPKHSAMHIQYSLNRDNAVNSRRDDWSLGSGNLRVSA